MIWLILGRATVATSVNLVVSPNSTLLKSGQTNLTLNLSTTQATACRWSNISSTYDNMVHDFSGLDKFHSTAVTGLSGDTQLSHVFVRCQVFPTEELHLVYRSLPDQSAASFPLTGNLWGWSNFKPPRRSLEYAASHIDLWLGADWNAEEIAILRRYNPATMVLTSINACEGPDGLPEDLYLHNVSRPASTKGRLESWPGAFRLDLTKLATQQYQAELMYQLMLYGGIGEGGQPPSTSNVTMPNDGIFVDNVFLTQSWATHDIHNNPFYPDTTGSGTADNLTQFDAKWRAGIVSELEMFRKRMPNALMSGHAMPAADLDIQHIFNAISIGFTPVYMIEGRTSFWDGWAEYESWMTLPKPTPHITMVESAVRLQLGYGYGFDSQLSQHMDQPGYISNATFEFSAHEYRYMRFGLAFTLMRDGYFAHELGDSWHGQDWWYDELNCKLGVPLGSAAFIGKVPAGHPPLRISSSQFGYWVRAPGAEASLTIDKVDKRSVGGSVKVVVVKTGPNLDGVDVQFDGLNISKALTYTLSFWAKSSIAGAEMGLNTRKAGSPWTQYGLQGAVILTNAWAPYTARFSLPRSLPADVTNGRLSFFLGKAPAESTVWIDNVTVSVSPPPVVMRQYECGMAILNGASTAQTVDVPAGFSRPNGTQAPKHQYIIDDASADFSAGVGWSAAWCSGEGTASPPQNSTCFVHGYNFDEPAAEENRGPYYHTWEQSTHIGSSDGSGEPAVFSLRLPEAGRYSLSAWWAAVTPAPNWSSAVEFKVLDAVGGHALSQATFDQSSAPTNGDRWTTIATDLALPIGAVVTVSCPGPAVCVADAVLVESMARLNDGRSTGPSLSLPAMDGALLVRDVCLD
jgi:hypothetical protein